MGAYISLSLEIGGRALIGASALKGTNRVLEHLCAHKVVFFTCFP